MKHGTSGICEGIVVVVLGGLRRRLLLWLNCLNYHGIVFQFRGLRHRRRRYRTQFIIPLLLLIVIVLSFPIVPLATRFLFAFSKIFLSLLPNYFIRLDAHAAGFGTDGLAVPPAILRSLPSRMLGSPGHHLQRPLVVSSAIQSLI